MTQICILISFLLGGFIISNTLYAQSQLTADNFESAVLTYEPQQRSEVSDKSFDFAKMVIRETKLAVEGDEEGFNRADYFNILTAFLSLKESEAIIQLAFEKFSQSKGSCEYFTSFIDNVNEKETYEPIREQFNARAAECEGNGKPETVFILSNYCKENGLNQNLVALIKDIDEKDKYYRKGDYDNHKVDQRALDIENQLTIDSLFAVHGNYLGESLVGPKFASTMWAVIQHSNEEMMEKYLPVMKNAVAQGEMGESMLKMTIDRYYALTEGFQVFGSQSGMNVDLATVEKRNEIAKLYGIKK
jgi:hypothetical protein